MGCACDWLRDGLIMRSNQTSLRKHTLYFADSVDHELIIFGALPHHLTKKLEYVGSECTSVRAG